MAPDRSAIVVGGGILELTSALELRQRGYAVRLLDPGPIPHPSPPRLTSARRARRVRRGRDLHASCRAGARLLARLEP